VINPLTSESPIQRPELSPTVSGSLSLCVTDREWVASDFACHSPHRVAGSVMSSAN
jgi:hypothetical protein